MEPSNLRAVSEIASNPVLLDECKRALPAIHANATMASGPEGVTKVVASLFVNFPQPQRSEGEWAEFWHGYHSVLSDQPLTALEAAKEAVLRDAKAEFIPKPGRFLELAKMTPNRAVKAYDRAKAAVEYQPPITREPIPKEQVQALIQPIGGKTRLEPNTADKERVRRMMREFIESDERRKAKELAKAPPRPQVAAAVDGSGISPELRAQRIREGAL